MKILTILGARPQFIKAGSASREIEVKAKIKEELEEPKIEVKITETQIKPKKISKIFE